MGYPALEICITCEQEKPLDEFFKCKAKKNGYMPLCKTCDLKRRREHFKSPIGQEKYNIARLRREYGITLTEYNKVLEEQNGVCAICDLPETETNSIGTKWLCVDHNHATGKIRGLLCNKCNQALGCFRDDKDVMLKAILYLEGE